MAWRRTCSKRTFRWPSITALAAKAEPLAAEGARVAETPADAARDADVILSILSDDDASRSAWTGEHGALSGAKPGAVLVGSSTVTPEWIAELAALAGKRRFDLLDAPVTGSRVQADGGQLTFLVGGNPAAFELARPVLAAMSKDISCCWAKVAAERE